MELFGPVEERRSSSIKVESEVEFVASSLALALALGHWKPSSSHHNYKNSHKAIDHKEPESHRVQKDRKPREPKIPEKQESQKAI